MKTLLTMTPAEMHAPNNDRTDALAAQFDAAGHKDMGDKVRAMKASGLNFLQILMQLLPVIMAFLGALFPVTPPTPAPTGTNQ